MPAKKPVPTPPADDAGIRPDPTWVVHTSKQGALDVPLLGRSIARGEAVEVSRVQADRLTQQEIWSEVQAPADDANNGENGD